MPGQPGTAPARGPPGAALNLTAAFSDFRASALSLKIKVCLIEQMFNTFTNSVLQAEITVQDQLQMVGTSRLEWMKENLLALNRIAAWLCRKH